MRNQDLVIHLYQKYIGFSSILIICLGIEVVTSSQILPYIICLAAYLLIFGRYCHATKGLVACLFAVLLITTAVFVCNGSYLSNLIKTVYFQANIAILVLPFFLKHPHNLPIDSHSRQSGNIASISFSLISLGSSFLFISYNGIYNLVPGFSDILLLVTAITVFVNFSIKRTGFMVASFLILVSCAIPLILSGSRYPIAVYMIFLLFNQFIKIYTARSQPFLKLMIRLLFCASLLALFLLACILALNNSSDLVRQFILHFGEVLRPKGFESDLLRFVEYPERLHGLLLRTSIIYGSGFAYVEEGWFEQNLPHNLYLYLLYIGGFCLLCLVLIVMFRVVLSFRKSPHLLAGSAIFLFAGSLVSSTLIIGSLPAPFAFSAAFLVSKYIYLSTI